MTHGAHLLSPKLIAPRIGTETLRPLLPSCLYSADGGLLEAMVERSRTRWGDLDRAVRMTVLLIMEAAQEALLKLMNPSA